jgi:hypothetical protein
MLAPPGKQDCRGTTTTSPLVAESRAVALTFFDER